MHMIWMNMIWRETRVFWGGIMQLASPVCSQPWHWITVTCIALGSLETTSLCPRGCAALSPCYVLSLWGPPFLFVTVPSLRAWSALRCHQKNNKKTDTTALELQSSSQLSQLNLSTADQVRQIFLPQKNLQIQSINANKSWQSAAAQCDDGCHGLVQRSSKGTGSQVFWPVGNKWCSLLCFAEPKACGRKVAGISEVSLWKVILLC